MNNKNQIIDTILRPRLLVPTAALVAGLCLLGPTVQAQELAGMGGFETQFAQQPASPIESFFRQRLSMASPVAIQWNEVESLYKAREFAPIWHDVAGLTSDGELLLQTLRDASLQGLDPADYDLNEVAASIQNPTERNMAWSDIVLTNTLLRYARDISLGRYRANDFDPQWYITQDAFDIRPALQSALENHELTQFIGRLAPQHEGYRALQQALIRYRNIAEQGGWSELPEFPALKPGETHEAVPLLRERLVKEGEYSGIVTEQPETYDWALASAVMNFQAHRGLADDGVVGAETRAALNVPVSERLDQILVNLERWRWLPSFLGEEYVFVNSAGYEMNLIRDNQVVLRQKTISGRPERQTPSFDSYIQRLVLNPTWTVPKRIAVEDLLPKQKKDPGFFRRSNIRPLRNIDGILTEIDPAGVDWSRYSANHFPFVLRQSAGDSNSLGRIKFDLPNQFAIYLHDTPAKSLFAKSTRAFSSGCIRLENASQLAEYLTVQDGQWSAQDLHHVLRKEDTRYHRLKRTVPVYIAYFTAWVDAGGRANFRPDIYSRNINLARAFGRGRTAPDIENLPAVETPAATLTGLLN